MDNVSLAEVERRYIVKILEKMSGHQIKTAQILGIDRRTLYRRLRQYGYGGHLHDEDSDFFDPSEETVQVRVPSL
ncbi:MAG: helix-turn-helix domain-containing protein [Blastocatellia bacterium]